MFDPITRLALGLVTGFLFGFLLQKGRLTNYRTIVGQFLLRDFTVLKVMMTAIVVGSIGVYAMRDLGLVELHIKPAVVWSVLVGGLVFGVGMALLGYCPGTAVGAIGEGSRHAVPGLLGMLAGAALYAELHVPLQGWLGGWNLGKVTLAELTGTSPWLWIAGLAVGAVGLFALIEWYERRINGQVRCQASQRPERVTSSQSLPGTPVGV